MDNTMTHTRKILLMLTAGLTIMFASCRIYDPIYDNAQPEHDPDHGSLTLTTDWSQRAEGAEIPDSYNVVLGDYSAAHTEQTHVIDYLFDPAEYRLHVWNEAQQITIDGTVASVAEYMARPMFFAAEEEYGGIIEGNPELLFTCAMDVELEKGKHHEITAPMRQQVRELTIVAELSDADMPVIRIRGVLMGVAKTLNFDTDEHGLPSDVEFEFEKNADGDWQATVHLLGVAGGWQNLYMEVYLAENEYFFIENDLTDELAEFNIDKKTPMTIRSVVE